MVSNTRRNGEYGRVDIPSTNNPVKICSIRGGESVTLKCLGGGEGSAFIGFDRHVRSGNSYQLESGETISIALPITFGPNNQLDIYADTDSIGTDVCFIKVIGQFPSSESST